MFGRAMGTEAHRGSKARQAEHVSVPTPAQIQIPGDIDLTLDRKSHLARCLKLL